MSELSRTGIVALVPTYNRPGPLVWSLLSVLRQAVPAAPAARRSVVVLNNGTPPHLVESAVELALREAGPHPWTVSVVHRDPPLDPQLNWYGGIDEHCADGDVAFLHGDDDLLLPGSIALRAGAILESGASCLLSRSHGGLFFDSSADRAFLRPIPSRPDAPLRPTALTAGGSAEFAAAFIGNHCYRAGPAHRSAVKTGMAWLRTLPLEGIQQLAMLPYFLPIAVADQDRLAGTLASCTIRGQGVDELVHRRFGHSTWRPGVLYAASLHVLSRGPLADRPDLDGHRVQLRSLATRWLLPTLVGSASRSEWRRLGGWRLCAPLEPGHLLDLARGAAMVGRAATGTQALRARLFEWRDGMSRNDLLRAIGLAGS